MLSDTLKKYFKSKRDIVAVYLFGSQAKGKAHSRSDIDIAVLYKYHTKLDIFDDTLKISCDLMRLLRVDKVDTVALNTANPVLKHQIYKYGKNILNNDKIAAIRFKAMSFLEYLDLLPARQEIERILRKRAVAYGR